MALHNRLSLRLPCFRCGREAELELMLKFGFRGQITYAIGDTYDWWPDLPVSRGGRPPEGTMDGAAWTLCPLCDQDFWLVVAVRQDRILGVTADPGILPNTPDAEMRGTVTCAGCRRTAEQELAVFHGIGPHQGGQADGERCGAARVDCLVCRERFFLLVKTVEGRVVESHPWDVGRPLPLERQGPDS
jgi:hypothetical protein